LSSFTFTGEQTAADELTDAELAELIDAMNEAEDEDYGEPAEPGYAGAAEQFDAAFTAHYAAEQDRQEARAAAIVEDTMFPAKRQEDKIARAMHRASQGVYDGGQADFTAEQAAVELAMVNGGYGPCGTPDEFGRCSSRWHDLSCSHSVSTDWAALPAESRLATELTGPKGYSHGWIREALGSALNAGSATESVARGAGLPLEPDGLRPHQQKIYHLMRASGHSHSRALAVARKAGAAIGRGLGVGEATRIFNQANESTVWGDPDSDEPSYEVPASAVELAHELAADWGMFGDVPGLDEVHARPDPMRLPAAPVSVADVLYEGIGYGGPPPEQPGYPGISELARQLGLK
jgi:hypothetical protein